MNRNRMRAGMIAALAIIFVLAASAIVSAGSYDRYAAATYASDNAYNNVPGSWYFGPRGGDCTNFISHCLQYGGWTETGKYNRYSSYSWYYDGVFPGYYSYTWTVADRFRDFLAYGGRAYPRSLAHTPWKNYFQLGDVIQMDKNGDGNWDHTMIVTGICSDDLLVSYHSPNARDKSLKAFKSEYEKKYPGTKFMGWCIRDRY